MTFIFLILLSILCQIKHPTAFIIPKVVDVTIHDYHVYTPDGLYKANLKKIFFSTSQRKIVLDKVSFTPGITEQIFIQKSGHPGEYLYG